MYIQTPHRWAPPPQNPSPPIIAALSTIPRETDSIKAPALTVLLAVILVLLVFLVHPLRPIFVSPSVETREVRKVLDKVWCVLVLVNRPVTSLPKSAVALMVCPLGVVTVHLLAVPNPRLPKLLLLTFAPPPPRHIGRPGPPQQLLAMFPESLYDVTIRVAIAKMTQPKRPPTIAPSTSLTLDLQI